MNKDSACPLGQGAGRADGGGGNRRPHAADRLRRERTPTRTSPPVQRSSAAPASKCARREGALIGKRDARGEDQRPTSTRSMRDPLRTSRSQGASRTSSAAIRTTCCSRSTSTSGRSSADASHRPRHRLRRAMGKKRQRELIKPVGDGLKAIGIDPLRDRDRDRQPHALRPHRQLRPVSARAITCRIARWPTPPDAACATRRCRAPFEPDDVVAMVRKVFTGRVTCSTTARTRSCPASPSTISAATPRDCRACG